MKPIRTATRTSASISKAARTRGAHFKMNRSTLRCLFSRRTYQAARKVNHTRAYVVMSSTKTVPFENNARDRNTYPMEIADKTMIQPENAPLAANTLSNIAQIHGGGDTALCITLLYRITE